VNGGVHKIKEEFEMEYNEDNMVMKVIQKESCKRFGVKEKYKKAKLYNKNGIDL